jgi:hypothetical protein
MALLASFRSISTTRILAVCAVVIAAVGFSASSSDAASGPAVVSSKGVVSTTLNGAAGLAVNMPAGVVPGDLLLVAVSADMNNKVGVTVGSAGWTKVFDAMRGTDVVRLTVFAKLATGNDSFITTTSFTPNTFAEDVVAQSLRITNHGVTNVATGLQGLTSANAVSGNANPPSTGTLASGNWLVLALAAPNFTSQSDNLSRVPAGYTEITRTKSTNKSTSAASLGVAYKTLSNATSEDPGTFGNSSRSWIAGTIAIPAK